ncbi:MAG: diguanylate cyclase [Acidobacteria bacterium]|nr:diguanylate cyclase [Acidobacteriota bacterium]
MRVLIADDLVVSRHLLEATLRKWSYEVVAAKDGNEAWDHLQRPDAPALAILDWMMPGLTGLDICRLVRKQNREPYTYILLLTSKNLKEDVVEGMEAGADDYVTKPFDQNELNVRLRAGRRIVELQAELLAAREELRVQATHDGLTRIWNRPAILDILQREIGRTAREGGPVSVIMLDLDEFKKVNDTHGHLAGDAVLCEAVRRIQSSMRSYDAIGRYGGEEFLVVLPGFDEAAACHQAERLRVAVARDPMKLSEGTVVVTASFGVTAGTAACGADPERLIHSADEALYEAKRAGRNRVMFAACKQPAP